MTIAPYKGGVHSAPWHMSSVTLVQRSYLSNPENDLEATFVAAG